LAKTQLVALAVFLAVATITTEAEVAQFSAARSLGPGGGAAGFGTGAKGGGGGSFMGMKITGPAPYGTGGKMSNRSGSGGGRASETLKLGKPGRQASGLSVFEKASRGLPLDEDELALLSPEQAAYWQSQRASAVLGVA